MTHKTATHQKAFHIDSMTVPDFFWVVLLPSTKLSIHTYDMALDTISLENYIKKKYFGKYFYLVEYGNTAAPSGLTFSLDETLFRTSDVGLTDDAGTILHEFDTRARVVEYDPTLYRIRVDAGEHYNFSANDVIGTFRNGNLA